MSEFLTASEMRRLTDCAAGAAQRRKLEELGVPFLADGSRLLVSRELVRQRMLGVELRQSAGPRMDLVR